MLSFCNGVLALERRVKLKSKKGSLVHTRFLHVTYGQKDKKTTPAKEVSSKRRNKGQERRFLSLNKTHVHVGNKERNYEFPGSILEGPKGPA